mmetsp:Transcript_12452/g.11287  ORF Transcript_12452/g.11287 Transcript_12452/m.11287 type:complete len:287 (+) Transcript_12452:36-896(+)|eukprot:CAMPEP_0196765380 /NCGR_PEP_ID=MMETSP1095-20130614/8430_1 /TAXON_ID=96789 ORGANISM="Chromulina nebulosa, Strain UTEXLB2642" /NCGR_SAMPLE_ID=MMETSP1095 /ASSEMBLY_ACC=CAM_ASM_000446 /LENGTH=286 /DNA_ID=CAMNT_0042123323 /DNA_START=18 /DNA_END=878 /DNA_ORIENTATION=+
MTEPKNSLLSLLLEFTESKRLEYDEFIVSSRNSFNEEAERVPDDFTDVLRTLTWTGEKGLILVEAKTKSASLRLIEAGLKVFNGCELFIMTRNDYDSKVLSDPVLSKDLIAIGGPYDKEEAQALVNTNYTNIVKRKEALLRKLTLMAEFSFVDDVSKAIATAILTKDDVMKSRSLLAAVTNMCEAFIVTPDPVLPCEPAIINNIARVFSELTGPAGRLQHLTLVEQILPYVKDIVKVAKEVAFSNLTVWSSDATQTELCTRIAFRVRGITVTAVEGEDYLLVNDDS